MSTSFSRRGFLQSIVVTAGLAFVGAPGCSSDSGGSTAPAPVEDGKKFFPQSVASGDPKPTSIVLWTRVEDAAASGDVMLTLEVSTTKEFAALAFSRSKLPATAAHDGTLKVKLTGLAARTTYFYRFVYEKDGKRYASAVGRTRTAPAADDTTPVRFAIASCQDYIGRYYHVWQRLLDVDPDLDAVIFLGDYVYETTGDPDFQTKTGTSRVVTLSDAAGAIKLKNANGAEYLAARSISNYRDLYKQYRNDPVLQQVHERWPMVFTWDDHEFSDDSHGSTATYTDGLIDETDDDRKRNAESVFYEFIPFDAGESADGRIDPGAIPTYPSSKIFRDFEYGKNVRLVVTDYRTYRPDHLIPEDAFPATIILDAAEMTTAGLADTFKSDSFAYVNIDDYNVEKSILKAAVKSLGVKAGLTEDEATARAARDVTGNLALVFVNAVLTNPAVNFSPIPPGDKPRGMAWVHFGKRDLYGLRGTRYIVLEDTFDAWSAYEYKKSGGKSEDAFGPEQDAWLKSKIAQAAPWKVVVSSVSLSKMVLDFRGKTDIPDTALQNRFYANCDGWDGFPNKKKELLAAAAAAPNTVFVAGDIHATFASNEGGVPCVTTPAITSGTFQDLIRNAVIGAGFDEASAVYKYAVTELDKSFAAGNPDIQYVDSTQHGITVLEIDGTAANVTYHLVPSSAALQPYEKSAEIKTQFVEKKFRIAGGKLSPA